MIQIDMPMPVNCLECRFNTSEFGYCNAMPVEFVGQINDFEEDSKPKWCPLKEQAPRVMALEELKSCNRETIWFQVKSNHTIKQLTQDGIAALIFIGLLHNWNGYGTIWRCWTSRPTDEQREATPWE